MEILRIEWETGYMELDVKAFFPCKLQSARKIAPLINRYCTEKDRATLLSELRGMSKYYQQEIQDYKDAHERFRRRHAAMGSIARLQELKDMKHCEIEIRKNEVLKKRTEKNISLIEQGRKK